MLAALPVALSLMSLIALTDPPPSLSSAEVARLWPRLAALTWEGAPLARAHQPPEIAAYAAQADLLLWARRVEDRLALCLFDAHDRRLRCAPLPPLAEVEALDEALALQLRWLVEAPPRSGTPWPPDPPFPPVERLDPRALADLRPPPRPRPPRRASWILPQLARPIEAPEGTHLEISPRAPRGHGQQLLISATARQGEAGWLGGLDGRLRLTGALWWATSLQAGGDGRGLMMGPEVGWGFLHARALGGAWSTTGQPYAPTGAVSLYGYKALGRFALSLGADLSSGPSSLWLGLGFFAL